MVLWRVVSDRAVTQITVTLLAASRHAPMLGSEGLLCDAGTMPAGRRACGPAMDGEATAW